MDNRTVTNNGPVNVVLHGQTIPANGGSGTVDFDSLYVGEKHDIQHRITAGTVTVSGGWTLPADPLSGEALQDARISAAIAGGGIQAYDPATTYPVGGVVYYGLALWESTSGGNIGHQPDISPGSWSPVISQGQLLGIVASLIVPLPLNSGATLGGVLVAALPGGGTAGTVIYATNGRKVGEGAGLGTGVPVYYSGGSWRVFGTDAVVTA